MPPIGMRVSAAAGLLSAYPMSLYMCSCVHMYARLLISFVEIKIKSERNELKPWNWCRCVKIGYRSAVSFPYTAERNS